MYSCKGSTMCLPLVEYCDGINHCPLGDDELFCIWPCPPECSCNGLSFTCSFNNITTLPWTLRRLDISGQAPLALYSGEFSSFKFLIDLNISSCGIRDLPIGIFEENHNLLYIDLSDNNIIQLWKGTFEGLNNLNSLLLIGNAIQMIEPYAFKPLRSIKSLVLKSQYMSYIKGNTFVGLDKCEILDISDNQVETLERGTFNGLDNLHILDMSRNDITFVHKQDFQDMQSLVRLKSDDYMFCCFVELSPENCDPKPDVLSSCTDLMGNMVLRVFLWFLGGFSLFGNMFVIIWRFISKENIKVPTFLVMNLALADFLTGIYLITLASVDSYYRGNYIENANGWLNSNLCKFLGVLSTIASEMSVLILCIITSDRLVNIISPFSSIKLNMKSALMITLGVWTAMLIIAVIPLFPSSYFQGKYYSRSGVCVSIHLTNEQVPGWEFSVAIFHALNFLVFMYIFGAYAYIYSFIKESSAASGGGSGKRELAAARKMTLIVITDFCCWVPINIMGMYILIKCFTKNYISYYI